MKKVPALLCTAALVAGLLPLSAVAAETTEVPATIPIGTQQLINAPVPCKGGAVLVRSESAGESDGKTEVVDTSTYTCDSAGRILSVQSEHDTNGGFPATSLTTYTYDAEGKLLSKHYEETCENTVDSLHIDYSYDTEGRLQSEKSLFSGQTEEVTTYSDYDANGNPTTSTRGDTVVHYTYDENGWLIGIDSTEYTRDSYGNEVTAKWGDGDDLETETISYTYDSFGNILTKSSDRSFDTTTYTYSVPAASDTDRTAPVIQVSQQNLIVNDTVISKCEKYNIDGANYFKLRDLASLLNGTGSQFSVGYDAATNTVTITKGEAYTAVGGELEVGADQSATAVVSEQTILIDGESVSNLSVYNLGGNNYFKLRDLGEALGFGVDYNEATNTAVVTSAVTTANDAVEVEE